MNKKLLKSSKQAIVLPRDPTRMTKVSLNGCGIISIKIDFSLKTAWLLIKSGSFFAIGQNFIETVCNVSGCKLKGTGLTLTNASRIF
jgi:hypothetical protein